MTPEEKAETVERARADVHAVLRAWKNTLTHDGRQLDFMWDALSINLDDAGQLDQLAEKAASDLHSLNLCLTVMNTLTEFGADWPDSFKRLAVNVMSGKVKPKRKRGGSVRKNYRRDQVIVKAMHAAIAHGLADYSSGNSTGVTAAELVASCLGEGDVSQNQKKNRPYGLPISKSEREAVPGAAAIKTIWQNRKEDQENK